MHWAELSSIFAVNGTENKDKQRGSMTFQVNCIEILMLKNEFQYDMCYFQFTVKPTKEVSLPKTSEQFITKFPLYD